MVNVEAPSIEALSDRHDFSQFSCGDEDLDAFLRDDAKRLHDQAVVRVTVASDENGRVLGYVASLADVLKVKANVRKSLNLQHDDHPNIPAVKIGRLAVHKDHQGQGIGKLLVKFAFDAAMSVSNEVGCRLLTLDAYEAKIEWYQNLGFIRNSQLATKVTPEDSKWACPVECPDRHKVDDCGARVGMRLDLWATNLPEWLNA